MNSKSKKINQFVENGMTLVWQRGDRFAKVWREIETGVYHLQAGYEGLGVDYREQHDDAASLENSMREIGNLRSWNYRQDWGF